LHRYNITQQMLTVFSGRDRDSVLEVH